MGAASECELRVVDGATGRVIIDGTHSQRVGARLGVPDDRRYIGVARDGREGVTEIDGRLTAYRRLRPGVGNANDWIVVASAKATAGSFLADMGPAPIGMLAVALVIVALAGVSLRTARRELEFQASTDGLMGLANRRELIADLGRRTRLATINQPLVLTLFDLNGFKNYNDTFGHPAGDTLLLRLASALAKAVAPLGARAYRPGGDEFCVIADVAQQQAMEHAACRALSERGEGFEVSTAFGSVVIPHDAADATEALRKADEAMYAQKHSGRANAGRQSSDVLLRALAERHPDLGDHLHGVAELAVEVGERLGIDGEELTQLRHAAVLHDIGKVGIPDAIITKPTRLSDDEWAFLHRHTLIGERIIAAAPALSSAARLVRSSHEAWDGSGYPDGLAAGEIPIGACIIAVCDAFDAMISDRPYAPPRTVDEALAELRRCAGTQFDAAIVSVFEQVLIDRAKRPTAAAA